MLRSKIGQLLWLSNQIRPDISFDVCVLATRLKEVTVKDILEANKIVRKVTSHSLKLCYQNLGPSECLKFVTFTDAEYANLIDGGSQGVYFIFLAGENGVCNLINWQSIVKSTLAAETLTFGEGIDSTVYVSSLFTEIYYGTSDFKRIPIEAVIDNQSLYDALKSTMCVSDKRLRVDTGAVKEMLCS